MPHLTFSFVPSSQAVVMASGLAEYLLLCIHNGSQIQSEASRKAASYFPFLLAMSTCCFTGAAWCQRELLMPECHSSLFLALYRSSWAFSSPVHYAKAVRLKTTARKSSGCLIISHQLAPWSAHFTS